MKKTDEKMNVILSQEPRCLAFVQQHIGSKFVELVIVLNDHPGSHRGLSYSCSGAWQR